MLRNGTFTEGWSDKPPAPGNLINQEPAGWHLEWLEPGQPLYDDPNSRSQGVPECVHKLSRQLPPHEQLGAPQALILAGDTTYKIFHSAAPFGATLSQTVTGLQPGSRGTLTVPVQVHMHGESDAFGAESGAWVNGQGGWAHGGEMGDRRWHRHRVEFTVPDNGQAEVVIRVKSKWARPKDFFIDNVTLEATPAGEGQPGGGTASGGSAGGGAGTGPGPAPARPKVRVRVPAGLNVSQMTSNIPGTVIIQVPPGVDVEVE